MSPPIWLNLPPARVWIYRRRGEGRPDTFDTTMPRDAQRLGPRSAEKAAFRPFREGREGFFKRRQARQPR